MIPRKKELIELLILSFKFENAFNLGYLTYTEWSIKIAYILNIDEYSIIRLLFSHLVKLNIFEKVKIKRRISYLFNPYKRIYKDKYHDYDGVVSFD